MLASAYCGGGGVGKCYPVLSNADGAEGLSLPDSLR